MPNAYPSEQVDEIIRETTDALEAALETNVKLAKENEKLQTRLKKAEEDRVILEKVASAPVLPVDGIQGLTQSMYVNGFLDKEEDAVKYASELEKNPALLLDIASSIIKISAAMPTSGTGVEKQGSSGSVKSQTLRELEEDGFIDVLKSHRK